MGKLSSQITHDDWTLWHESRVAPDFVDDKS